MTERPDLEKLLALRAEIEDHHQRCIEAQAESNAELFEKHAGERRFKRHLLRDRLEDALPAIADYVRELEGIRDFYATAKPIELANDDGDMARSGKARARGDQE